LTKDQGNEDWDYIPVTLSDFAKEWAKAILEEDPTKDKDPTENDSPNKEMDIQKLLLRLERTNCISEGERLKASIKCYNVI
jgi:hypothetical protein